MTSKEVLAMEDKLREECGAYVLLERERGKDETMELCVKAFMALDDYRIALEKEEARRAATQADNYKLITPLL